MLGSCHTRAARTPPRVGAAGGTTCLADGWWMYRLNGVQFSGLEWSIRTLSGHIERNNAVGRRWVADLADWEPFRMVPYTPQPFDDPLPPSAGFARKREFLAPHPFCNARRSTETHVNVSFCEAAEGPVAGTASRE